jgi:hypothetical protein
MYVYNPLGYSSSFERTPGLIPDGIATHVTSSTKKRKSMSIQTVMNNDIFKYPRALKNQKREQKLVQKKPGFYQVDSLDFVNSLNSLDFLDLLKSLKSMDASDFLGCKDVDFHCYENAEEIFEDIDMEKQLSEMTVLPVQETVWANGSEFRHLSKDYKVGHVSEELMYPSFQHWGTNKKHFS